MNQASQPLNSSFAAEIKESFALQSVMSLIGAELSMVAPGVVEITLPYRSDLAQQHGYLHAGMLCRLQSDARRLGSSER